MVLEFAHEVWPVFCGRGCEGSSRDSLVNWLEKIDGSELRGPFPLLCGFSGDLSGKTPPICQCFRQVKIKSGCYVKMIRKVKGQ